MLLLKLTVLFFLSCLYRSLEFGLTLQHNKEATEAFFSLMGGTSVAHGLQLSCLALKSIVQDLFHISDGLLKGFNIFRLGPDLLLDDKRVPF